MLLTVPPSLSRYVKCMRYVPAEAIVAEYTRLPDGEAELLVRSQAITLIGPRTTQLAKHADNSEAALVIRFRIGGAYPFFGPMSELTDATLPFAAPPARIISWLETKLAGDHRFDPSAGPRLRRAIASDLPPKTVRELAASIGLSERQLRRVCEDAVGLTPKRLLRALRLRRALARARSAPAPSWTTIAAESGYFDQAHLIADFKSMLGVTPSAWREQLSARRHSLEQDTQDVARRVGPARNRQ